MDDAGGAADTRLVDLGRVIQEHLEERHLTKKQLADELGVDPSRVSRLVSGQDRAVTLERICRIEDVLDLRRGQILVEAGYVADVTTVEEAIEMERLPRRVKDVLLGAVDRAREGRV